MRFDLLLIAFLGTLTFSLSTVLHGSMEQWEAGRRSGDGVLAALLGDSRRMFATHYFVKADAYFHSGYYPSIFDTQDPNQQAHIAEHAAGAAEEEEVDFQGPPRDWIDSFSRSFRPNRHRHLDDMDEAGQEHDSHSRGEAGQGDPDNHSGPKTHSIDSKTGEHPSLKSSGSLSTVDTKGKTPSLAREILPWLRLSASLDPERIQTYVVGAYFLRNMDRVDQAEIFLRDGFRQNPRSYEILVELGKICSETHHDPDRARNFWEAGLRYWKEQQLSKPEELRDFLAHATLLGNLAKLEDGAGHPAKAIQYLAELMQISPNKKALSQWIDELRQKTP